MVKLLLCWDLNLFCCLCYFIVFMYVIVSLCPLFYTSTVSSSGAEAISLLCSALSMVAPFSLPAVWRYQSERVRDNIDEQDTHVSILMDKQKPDPQQGSPGTLWGAVCKMLGLLCSHMHQWRLKTLRIRFWLFCWGFYCCYGAPWWDTICNFWSAGMQEERWQIRGTKYFKMNELPEKECVSACNLWGWNIRADNLLSEIRWSLKFWI